MLLFAVDQCVSSELNRCENGATCIPDGNGLVCECVSGYNGTYCEVNIDDCVNSPCIHGNCEDRVNDYRCDCEAGLKVCSL